MKNAGSTVVARIQGAAALSATAAANADAPKPAAAKPAKPAKSAKANKTPKAKPVAAAPSDHCAIDDLGFDSMLAKKSDAPAAPAPKKDKSKIDGLAQSKAAADSWDLGRKSRDASRPVDGSAEVKMQAKTLSLSQVAAVVTDKQGDLEYCIMNIPEKDRGTEQFTLHLEISAKGAIVSSSLSGDENAAKIDACVQEQVKRWTFPQADAPTDIDYPLSFHVQHIDS
jgi:hypothetical protein